MEEVEIEVTPFDCPYVKADDPCEGCESDCVCKIWIREDLLIWK